MDSSDVIKFSSGFLKGVLGDHDYSYLEQCMDSTNVLVDDIHTMMTDLTEGGITGMSKVAMDVVKYFQDLPPTLENCTAGASDFEKLAEMLLVLADPTVLMARVSYNLVFHPWKIAQYSMDSLTAWNNNDPEMCGEDLAKAFMQCVAEVGNEDGGYEPNGDHELFL